MKQRTLAGLLALIALACLTSPAATAGLFDKLKEKAQEAIAEEKAAVEDSADDAPTHQSSKPTETSTPGAATKPDSPPLTTDNGTPTEAARVYVLVHYAPQVLEDDVWLKALARRAMPGVRGWITSDEFRWRREKDDIRAQLRAAAAQVPTRYDITPWPDAGATITLGKYDFDRQAFGMSGVHWPWARENKMRWLSVPTAEAEKLAASFGSQPRNLFGKYTLVIAGADVKAPDPRRRGDVWDLVRWDDRIDKIDFYVRKGFSGPRREDYEYALTLDTRDFESENSTVGP